MKDVMREYTVYARSILPDLPESWLVYHARHLDDGNIFLEGAEAYTITRGPRKGCTGWRKPMRGHKALVMPREAKP